MLQVFVLFSELRWFGLHCSSNLSLLFFFVSTWNMFWNLKKHFPKNLEFGYLKKVETHHKTHRANFFSSLFSLWNEPESLENLQNIFWQNFFLKRVYTKFQKSILFLLLCACVCLIYLINLPFSHCQAALGNILSVIFVHLFFLGFLTCHFSFWPKVDKAV